MNNQRIIHFPDVPKDGDIHQEYGRPVAVF